MSRPLHIKGNLRSVVRNRQPVRSVQPNVRRGFVCCLLAALASCGSDADRPPSAADTTEATARPTVSLFSTTVPLDSSPPPSNLTTATTTSSGRAHEVVPVNTVATSEQVPTIPFEISPLPPDQAPRLSVEDVLAMLQRAEFARFFETDADLANVSITVGLITDHSQTYGDASDDPSFPGYVVEGGHSICYPSGPALVPPSTSGPNEIACYTRLVINGDTGEVPTYSEVGLP